MNSLETKAYYHAMRDRFESSDFETYHLFLREVATSTQHHQDLFIEMYIAHYRQALAIGLMKLATDIAFNLCELKWPSNKNTLNQIRELLAIAPMPDRTYFIHAF